MFLKKVGELPQQNAKNQLEPLHIQLVY